MKYKRVLLKLSGEALMGEHNHGIDPIRLMTTPLRLKKFMKKEQR